MTGFAKEQFQDVERLPSIAWNEAEEGTADSDHPLVCELRSSLLLGSLQKAMEALDRRDAARARWGGG